MALATSLTELGCALLGAGIEPNGSIPGPDLDRVEFTHRLTRPQPARRPFLHAIYHWVVFVALLPVVLVMLVVAAKNFSAEVEDEIVLFER